MAWITVRNPTHVTYHNPATRERLYRPAVWAGNVLRSGHVMQHTWRSNYPPFKRLRDCLAHRKRVLDRLHRISGGGPA